MRVNTMLQASRLQQWSEAFLWLAVSLVLIFSDMPIWSKALALLCLFLWVLYQRILQKPTSRLVQLIQFDTKTWRWSVYEPHRIKKNNIYDGRLMRVQSGFCFVVLTLERLEKNQSVTTRWIIWQDQVDRDHWRRLLVMARFWTNDVETVKPELLKH